MGYDHLNFSAAIPSDLESHAPSVPVDIFGIFSSLFPLLPSNSVDHAMLQGSPSPPKLFIAHMLEDNGMPVSKWDFLNLMLLTTNLLAATIDLESLQLILQNLLSPMNVSTGFGSSNEALSNTNFTNFSLVGHNGINLKDKKTLVVCTSHASCFALHANFNFVVDC